MNKQQRKELRSYVDELQEIRDRMDEITMNFESMRDDEQDKFDNLPESIQYSDRGQEMEEGISSLDDMSSTCDSIRDDINDLADEIEETFLS